MAILGAKLIAVGNGTVVLGVNFSLLALSTQKLETLLAM
jgi:hypothetical protein